MSVKRSSKSVIKTSKLRTLPCIKNGRCQETQKDMTDIAKKFKKPRKKVLCIINSYIHTQKDPSCKNLPHDCRGYSVLHLAVERNLIPVADTLLESGFDPLTPVCKENTGKLALQVAIEKGFDEMAALIIRHMENAHVRDIFLKYPENFELVGCTHGGQTNREIVDVLSVHYLIQKMCVKSIHAVFNSLKDDRNNGRCTVYVKLLEEDDSGLEPDENAFNAYHHTVFHNLTNANKNVANHPVIGMLIDHKWKAWGRRAFGKSFMLYLMSLVALTFAIVSGVMADDIRTYDTSLQRARGFCELVICFLAFCKLTTEVLKMKRNILEYRKQFFNWIDVLSSACIFIDVLLRYTTEKAHWFVLAVAYMFWILRIFKYAAVSNQTGVYAESLRQILTNNFVPFSLLFIVVNLAFGIILLLVLKGEDRLNTHTETSTIYGILFVGLRTMIEAQPAVDYTGSDGYGTASIVVMLVFMATTIVVLLNILIAQLSYTYSKIQDDAEKSFRANRVGFLTRLERNEWQILYFLVTYVCQNKLLVWILSLCGCTSFGPDKWTAFAMSNRRKHHKSVFIDVDLGKYQSIPTTIEDMYGIIYESKKAQIHIDLKAQTIKARLRQLDAKIEKNFQAIKMKTNIVSDSDTDTTITNESDSDTTSTSSSDCQMHSQLENMRSTEPEIEIVQHLETRGLSGDEITVQNQTVRKPMNHFEKSYFVPETTI